MYVFMYIYIYIYIYYIYIILFVSNELKLGSFLRSCMVYLYVWLNSLIGVLHIRPHQRCKHTPPHLDHA